MLKMAWMRLTAAFAVALLAFSLGGAASAGPIVRIASGQIEGESLRDLNVFRGIPYAAPPTGPLRWRPPQAAASWTGVRPAQTFGPACLQPNRGDGLGGGVATRQSEDCLTLNVWAPANARNLPVMVWIHGGAHRIGSGSFAVYDGANLARHGVILVSINYRLGLLGWFAHPALTAEAGPNDPLGNYGLMDEIAALQWVRDNIAAFGGDPNNVTAFGESAGGADMLYLLANPHARGLFQRAIVESGGGLAQSQSLAVREQAGLAAARNLGLPDTATLADLRARPAGDWVTAQGPLQGGLGFGPFMDGRLVTEAPWRAFLAGRAADVPLMIGSNSNEASVLAALGANMNAIQFAGDQLPAMRAAYGAPPLSDAELSRQAAGDAVFVAPARFVAAATASGAPSFLYHFDYVPVVRRASTPGAAHGSEIPFVFDSWDQLPMAARFLQPADRRMAARMSACWTSFARDGRPTCPNAPAWPAYTAAADPTMVFGPETRVELGYRRAQQDFILRRMMSAGGR